MSEIANSEEEGEELAGKEEEPFRSRLLPTRRISFSSSSREVGSLTIMPKKKEMFCKDIFIEMTEKETGLPLSCFNCYDILSFCISEFA